MFQKINFSKPVILMFQLIKFEKFLRLEQSEGQVSCLKSTNVGLQEKLNELQQTNEVYILLYLVLKSFKTFKEFNF